MLEQIKTIATSNYGKLVNLGSIPEYIEYDGKKIEIPPKGTISKIEFSKLGKHSDQVVFIKK